MRAATKFGARIRPRGRAGREFRGELLTVGEAAEFLRMSPETLNDWRSQRKRCGPKFFKVHRHRILYRMADLESFLERRAVDPVGQKSERDLLSNYNLRPGI